MGFDRRYWVWMPHAAHYICGHDCRYHLATCVGHFVVSTVGEYLPDESVREIIAKSQGVKLEGKGDHRRADFLAKIGYHQIGCDRLYETMVFRARKADPETGENCGCPYLMADSTEVDFRGTNDGATAYLNHMELCEKWSRVDLTSYGEGTDEI